MVWGVHEVTESQTQLSNTYTHIVLRRLRFEDKEPELNTPWAP